MNIFFVALLFACTAYALIAGGAPERIGAAAYAVSCFVTVALFAAPPIRWRSVEIGGFIVDVVMFTFFCVLALRANRFWPIWVSGLLGLGVLGHLGRWAGPDVFWWAYAVILSIWSYPIVLLFALGTWAHQRRLALHGADPSWSTSSVRSGRAPLDGPTA